jgi:hypothetical protein
LKHRQLRSPAIKAELFAQLRQLRVIPFGDIDRIALERSDEDPKRIGCNGTLDAVSLS